MNYSSISIPRSFEHKTSFFNIAYALSSIWKTSFNTIFYILVNFYFLVSPLRIKVLLVANFNPNGKLLLPLQLKKEFPINTMVIVILFHWHAAPQNKSQMLLVQVPDLVLNTSPEAHIEIGFSYKVAMWITQTILLLIFLRYYQNQKTILKCLQGTHPSQITHP